MDVTTGLMSLIVVTLYVLAIIRILQSSADTLTKFVWIVIVLLVPILGVGIWWFYGPK